MDRQALAGALAAHVQYPRESRWALRSGGYERQCVARSLYHRCFDGTIEFGQVSLQLDCRKCASKCVASKQASKQASERASRRGRGRARWRVQVGHGPPFQQTSSTRARAQRRGREVDLSGHRLVPAPSHSRRERAPSPTCLFRVFLLPRDSGQPPLGEKVSAFYRGRYSTTNYGRLASWVTDGRTDGWVGGWGGWLAGVLSSRWPRCPYRDSCTPCVRGPPAASSLAAHCMQSLQCVDSMYAQYV